MLLRRVRGLSYFHSWETKSSLLSCRFIQFASESSQWFCGSCLARNSISSTRCESCGAENTNRHRNTTENPSLLRSKRQSSLSQRSALEALLKEEEGEEGSNRYSTSSVYGTEERSEKGLGDHRLRSSGFDSLPLLSQLDRSSLRKHQYNERKFEADDQQHDNEDRQDSREYKDDWKCPVCFYPNFGSRSDCRKCKADRPPKGLFNTRIQRKSNGQKTNATNDNVKNSDTNGKRSKRTSPPSNVFTIAQSVSSPPRPPTSRLVPLHPLYKSYGSVPCITGEGVTRERYLAMIEHSVGGPPVPQDTSDASMKEFLHSMQLGDWGCGKCGVLNKRIRTECFHCGRNKFLQSRIRENVHTPTKSEDLFPKLPVPYVSVTGWHFQLKLAKMQAIYKPLYDKACAPQLKKSENERIKKGFEVDEWLKRQHYTELEPIDTSAIDPSLQALTPSQRHTYLFIEPSWFCEHCGFLSSPSERLPKPWRTKVLDGSMSPYESRVHVWLSKYRPICEHCVTKKSQSPDKVNHGRHVVSGATHDAKNIKTDKKKVRTSNEDKNKSSLLRKARLQALAPKDEITGKFLIKGKSAISSLVGDWTCKCGIVNYRLRRVCVACGKGRIAGMLPYDLTAPVRYGDWVCSCCLLWNFRQNLQCFNCCYAKGTGVSEEGSEDRAMSKQDSPRWTGEDAVRLGFRHDPPLPKDESNRRNDGILSSLYKHAGDNKQQGFLSASKFSTGFMSDALFIVGEDMIPYAEEVALREELSKAAAKNGRQELSRSLQTVNQHSSTQTNEAWLEQSNLTTATLTKHLKASFGRSVVKVGECPKCLHKHRLDEFGPGSTCVKCKTTMFPMVFPKWEAITKLNEQISFPNSPQKHAKEKGTTLGALNSLPQLSPLAVALSSKPGFLFASLPCHKCGAFNCEVRERCRRCGHQHTWVCNATVDDGGEGESKVCNTRNAAEKGYCSECGTARPSGGQVILERVEGSRSLLLKRD